MAKILLVGESWHVHSIHQKGFDVFTESTYGEGAGHFLDALKDTRHDVTYIRSHEIATAFPTDADSLSAFDAIVISDVGANTFQLTPGVFGDSVPGSDYIAAIRRFVGEGGGLLMVGGYLSFSGIDAKARWGRTDLGEVLPVEMFDRDDRVEFPAGLAPVLQGGHEVTRDLEQQWPILLGINEVVPKPGSQTLVSIGTHPLLVVGEFEGGRAAAFTSDFAPHWAPREFTSWPGYRTLWDQLLTWLSGDA